MKFRGHPLHEPWGCSCGWTTKDLFRGQVGCQIEVNSLRHKELEPDPRELSETNGEPERSRERHGGSRTRGSRCTDRETGANAETHGETTSTWGGCSSPGGSWEARRCAGRGIPVSQRRGPALYRASLVLGRGQGKRHPRAGTRARLERETALSEPGTVPLPLRRRLWARLFHRRDATHRRSNQAIHRDHKPSPAGKPSAVL